MKTVFLARSAPGSLICRVDTAVAISFSFVLWELFGRDFGAVIYNANLLMPQASVVLGMTPHSHLCEDHLRDL